MAEVDDPELIDSLQKTFASRSELKTLVEYQQRLYASIKELNNNHIAIHRHVSKLTESHNTVRGDADGLIRTRNEIKDTLRSLSDSHAKTREEIRRAIELINYIQQELRKIPALEQRLHKLEQR